MKKSRIDEDDVKDIMRLKAMIGNDNKFKRYVYNISEEEQKQYGYGFIGEYSYEPNPNSYNLNTTYRNSYDRTIYIKTKRGWEVFLKDGSDGKNGIAGGGLGFNDVSRLIDDKLKDFSQSGMDLGLIQQMIDNSLSTYQPIVNASNVSVSGNFLNISGTNINQMLLSIDNKLNNINYLENYKTHDYETIPGVPEIMYVGKMNQFSYWYVRKVVTDSLGNISTYHANISNNISYTTYIDAWNNRANLVFGNLEDLLFV
jgi:hypothetical protein